LRRNEEKEYGTISQILTDRPLYYNSLKNDSGKRKRRKKRGYPADLPVFGYCLVMAKNVPLFHPPLEKIREILGL